MTFRVGDPFVCCHLIIKKGIRGKSSYICSYMAVGFLRLYLNLLTHFRLKSKARVDLKKSGKKMIFPSGRQTTWEEQVSSNGLKCIGAD